MTDFDDKINKIFKKYTWKRLGRLKKGHKRFSTEVVSQTVLAFYLRIGGACYWLPRKNVTVGIHPRGSYYAVDIPQWLIDKHKISQQ